MKRVGLGAAWAVVAFACNPPNVSMIVDLPATVQGETAWIEIGAIPSVCPPASVLGGGLPPSGLASRIAYGADAAPLPLGDLDTAVYGFAAVARRDDCGVVAAGCMVADMSGTRSLDISLDPTGDPDASACTNGLICSNAQCVPPTTSNDPNAGAGCSMVLIGAGPLPDALDGGPFVTAPAIAATATGFLIVYGEYLGADGTYRITIQPLDDGGGALPPLQQQIMNYCPGLSKIDAAGLDMGTNGGLAVVSQPNCMNQTGFNLLSLDAMGNITKQSFASSGSTTVALSTHALTAAAAANRWLLAASESSSVLLVSDGATAIPQTITPFGTTSDTAARVVHSTSLTAVEVDGPSVGDAGMPGTVARVYLASGASDPTTLGSPVDQPPVTNTGLTVLGTRAFLVMNGAGNGEDVAFNGYDLGGKTVPAVTGGFGAPSPIMSSPILAMDAAATQNRLFAAFEQQDSISIGVIDGATTTSPQILTRVDLASDIRIPASAHDGPLAIAVSGTRVAITWVSHHDALADGDTVGGYAVFACQP